MLAYYRHHPIFGQNARGGIEKNAANSAFARYFLGLGRKIPDMRTLGNRAAQFAKKNRMAIAGVGIGTAAGLWLGNKAYNNAIPPVRQLPGLDLPLQIPASQAIQYGCEEFNNQLNSQTNLASSQF